MIFVPVLPVMSKRDMINLYYIYVKIIMTIIFLRQSKTHKIQMFPPVQKIVGSIPGRININYKIGGGCFTANYAILRNKSKNCSNMSSCELLFQCASSNMSSCELLFQCASTMKLSVLVQYKTDSFFISLKSSMFSKHVFYWS